MPCVKQFGMLFITGRNKAEWFNEYAEYCRSYAQELVACGSC